MLVRFTETLGAFISLMIGPIPSRDNPSGYMQARIIAAKRLMKEAAREWARGNHDEAAYVFSSASAELRKCASDARFLHR